MKKINNFPVSLDDPEALKNAEQVFSAICSKLSEGDREPPVALSSWKAFVESYEVEIDGPLYALCITFGGSTVGYSETDSVNELLLTASEMGDGMDCEALDYSFTSLTKDNAGVLEGYQWLVAPDNKRAKLLVYFAGISLKVLDTLETLADSECFDVDCVQLFVRGERQAVWSAFAWPLDHFNDMFAPTDVWDFVLDIPGQQPDETDEDYDARLAEICETSDYTLKSVWRDGWDLVRVATSSGYPKEGLLDTLKGFRPSDLAKVET